VNGSLARPPLLRFMHIHPRPVVIQTRLELRPLTGRMTIELGSLGYADWLVMVVGLTALSLLRC